MRQSPSRRAALPTLVALTLAVSVPVPARAGSISATTMSFEQAVALSRRVVAGTVVATTSFEIDGERFGALEVRVDAALKGPSAHPGEVLRLFEPAPWFRHTHAAVIKAGVISYAEPRYASPSPVAVGARALFLLSDAAPPPGFPPNAAFLVCDEAHAGAALAPRVALVRGAELDGVVRLRAKEIAVFPGGLSLELAGFVDKRPTTGGPSKEAVDVELRQGTRKQAMGLGHVVEPDGRATWDTRVWNGYAITLIKIDAGEAASFRVRLERR
jgi:hypothetical protein